MQVQALWLRLQERCLPKVPAAEGIDYDEKEERITGLF